MEHHDYECMSERLFKPLEKWFGCDHIVKRQLIKDLTMRNRLILELRTFDARKRNNMNQENQSDLLSNEDIQQVELGDDLDQKSYGPSSQNNSRTEEEKEEEVVIDDQKQSFFKSDDPKTIVIDDPNDGVEDTNLNNYNINEGMEEVQQPQSHQNESINQDEHSENEMIVENNEDVFN